MRTICLYFQVHQPYRLKRYRFFDIGHDHYYYDDYTNESILRKVADNCYLPANDVINELINTYPGKFKVAFSISGMALDQFEMYAPDVLESFQKLAGTGAVEFLAETNAHSLSALKNREEFKKQVGEHVGKVERLFGQTPGIFRNTELVYSDEIGATVAEMGYRGMLTEGAKHILGWKSPNFLYTNAINPRLKILLKNFKLSDDVAFRFSDKGWSEYPLTPDKFISWLNQIDQKEETVNLFMDYETFGEHQWADTGIFDFLRDLPGAIIDNTDFTFSTPSEVVDNHQPVSSVQVPYPISWADEERDVTAWLGNEMQQEAFNKLYDLAGKVAKANDPVLWKDWNYLQVSDHFYYMCTKFFSDAAVHAYFNPYKSPYDAFINYMNVLSDFAIRVHNAVPETDKDKEIAYLNRIIEEKEEQISRYKEEVDVLNSLVSVPTPEPAAKKPAVKKVSAAQKGTAKASAGKASGASATKKSAPAKKASSTKKKSGTSTTKKSAPAARKTTGKAAKTTGTKVGKSTGTKSRKK